MMSQRRSFRGAARVLWSLAVLPLLLLAGAERPSQQNETEAAISDAGQTETARSSLIEQGEYLVNHVAMCVVCHSPKNDKGEIIEQRLLEGSPIPVESPYPDQRWALKAPRLAGLPGGWSEESLARFLQTGEAPTSGKIRPPMPPFRMTARDAKAVAAYLNSLGSD